uniref:Uncharacterized protein n=1 Tax=Lepeophtheirus salmonis TaxID=72036 RepID=A0A0K2V721_LEPSM
MVVTMPLSAFYDLYSPTTGCHSRTCSPSPLL